MNAAISLINLRMLWTQPATLPRRPPQRLPQTVLDAWIRNSPGLVLVGN
ncbi:hypothetical protein [Nostoc commune]|nr:hypothetical protein [Nostoc commune]